MADDKEVERLAKELESLRTAMSQLMKSFEIASQLAQNYLKLVNIYAQHGDLSIDVVIPQIRHDQIARDIVKILFDTKGGNISQIARELKAKRGKASRNTVREKIKHLVEIGVVDEVNSEKGKTYTLRKEVINKWLELIGIPIKFDQL
ncbi:hypothetical protein PAP_06775 [Palaeococcus pacificus DY20341]|uniref:ArsR family transcriptional regulator n=1 Tax=Palaeococcus pacificus DY20341 TaxID=1343739 RepID=A0A075LSL8_9EURY|nr:ArsR family transcriptional regulator [Palaeococcus pacificus]AIF69750.1 hypothetical protein PAP_06775 [Palaeococcus pacificus DY20341]